VDSYVKTSIERPGQYQSILLKIADCDRRVELWFYRSNGKGAMLKKVAALEAALADVRAEIEEWE
jgi:hypothetical protein